MYRLTTSLAPGSRANALAIRAGERRKAEAEEPWGSEYPNSWREPKPLPPPSPTPRPESNPDWDSYYWPEPSDDPFGEH